MTSSRAPEEAEAQQADGKRGLNEAESASPLFSAMVEKKSLHFRKSRPNVASLQCH
jgi:hypothetical protein